MESKHPELRFSGFDEEWNKRKLGEIVSIFKGEQRGKQEISIIRTDENPYPVYNGGRNVSGYTDEYNRENKVMLSEGGASAGFVNYYKDKYWSGGHNFTIDNLENNLDFIYAILSANQDKLYGLKVGSGLPNIQLNSIVNFEVSLPSIEEQKKLGFFFKNMNDVITFQQQELTTLKQIKQGFLQKMFPKEGEKVPEVRFPGFTDDWEQHNLTDVGSLNRGKSKHRPRNDPKLYGGKYPFIQTGDVARAGLFLNNYQQTYSEYGIKQSKLWDKGTLLITIAANIAETSILNIKAAFPDSVIGFESNQVDMVFIKNIIDNASNTLKSKAETSSQANLNLSKLSELTIIIPTYNEQKKIGDFFKQLDKTISLHQRELELLQLTKKAFLQKLFV
ncbi:restriction endonuclease subunit S [Enterococcus devriesei]|uniref:restriction endonuclease subunit S n=1 Tax=Enterococcus devriesei TaxID=319970 RepID=UPI0028EA7F16|nr:restriction endonuclease subunit S [Enterococcus devriesei]